jgi:hypothetical protein
MPPPTAPIYTLHLGSRDGAVIAKDEFIPLITKRFPSFSLTEGTGYYEGSPDPGWSIRISTADTAAVVALAEELRSTFEQFGVGVEAFGHYHRCREANRGEDLLAQLWGSRHGLEPAYFRTVFLVGEAVPVWSERFAIITAYATTGETWTEERNQAADEKLRDRLSAFGLSPLRVTGCSPDLRHQEPGWAVETNLFQALALGREFLQDAIYWVEGDRLGVVSCHTGKVVSVGTFRQRVSLS